MIKIDNLRYEALLREAEMILMQGRGPVSIINLLVNQGLPRSLAKEGARELFVEARQRVIRRQRIFIRIRRVIFALGILLIPFGLLLQEYPLLSVSPVLLFLGFYLKSSIVIPPEIHLFDLLETK